MKKVLVLAALVAFVAMVLVARRRPKGTNEHTIAEASTTDHRAGAASPSVQEFHTGERASSTEVTSLRLEGQVIDGDEIAVADATVVLGPDHGVVRTGKDGIFRFERLQPGQFTLFARTDALAAGPVSVTLDERSGPVTLRAALAGHTRLAVVDDATNEKLDRCEARLLDGSGAAVAGDEGGLLLVGGLTRGSHPLRVSRDGYAPRFLSVNADDEGAPVRQVRLVRGVPIEGRAIAEGRPAAKTQVRIEAQGVLPTASGPLPTDEVETDEQGRFRFGAVSAGRIRLAARHDLLGIGSTTVEVDGRGASRGVEIILQRGRSLQGRVEDAKGARVPFATVRVAEAGTANGLGGARRTLCDQSGTFRMVGLSAGQVRVLATFGAASSREVEADLARRDAEVVLRIDGSASIEGVVVTAGGEPVSDAQVAATPEPGAGNVVRSSDPDLLGIGTAMTDAGGHFVLRGLATGAYRIRASNGPTVDSLTFWMRAGVLVSTGAKDARVVVDDGGIVRGRVAFSDGTVPSAFTVSVTYAPAMPFSSADGTFEIRGIPSGTQTVAVAGPDIAARFVEHVAVEAGKAADVGEIRVERLRSVRGSVTRPDGTPVGGASVTLGTTLIGQGSRLSHEASSGVLQAITASDGSFVVSQAPRAPLFALAEHPAYGRSATLPIPPDEEEAPLTLVLQPTSTLTGTVRRLGAPLAQAIVVATTPSANRCRFASVTDSDGTYTFDALAPDTYVVAATYQPDLQHMTQDVVSVTVATGVPGHADFEIPATGSAVTVALSGKPLPVAAQFWLVSGSVFAENLGQLETAIAARGAGTNFMVQGLGSVPAEFEGPDDGAYSLCVASISSDVTDLATRLAVQRRAALLPTRCVPLVVRHGGSPTKVTFDVD